MPPRRVCGVAAASGGGNGVGGCIGCMRLTVRAARPHAQDPARAAVERVPADVSARLPARLVRPAAAAPRRVDERGRAPTLPPLPAPPASALLTALCGPCAASAPRAGVGAAVCAAWVLPAASAAAAAAVGAHGPPHSPAGGAGEGPQRPTYQYLRLGDEKMR